MSCNWNRGCIRLRVCGLFDATAVLVILWYLEL